MKDNIEDIILEVIIKYDPKNTEKLVDIMVAKTNFSQDEITNHVLGLSRENKIHFVEQNPGKANNFVEYLFLRDNVWFWIIMIIEILAISSFYLIDYNSPFVLIRHLSNLIYVLIIPGFTLIKYFFSEKILSLDEITMGSMILSITVVSAIGTIFYYSFIGLNINMIILSVFLITIIFSFLSLIKTYNKNNANGDL